MKQLLILLAQVPALLIGQIPGNPNASGTITPGPPDWVTGQPVNPGVLTLQFEYTQSEIDSMLDGSKSFTEITSSGNLLIIGEYPGLLGTMVTNTHDSPILVAGAVHQLTNDLGYWGLIGMTSSASTIGSSARRVDRPGPVLCPAVSP